MRVIRDLTKNGASEPHAVTIGAYDGVHLGHRAVIDATRLVASRLDSQLAVVTFDPHPAQVLRPENAPLLLVDLEQKLELLERAGVDMTVVVPFDAECASETPAEFVQRVLVDVCQASAVVVGHDFHFGKARAGNVDVLRRIGKEEGFEVEGLQLIPRPDGKDESVSSTSIRRALAGGEVRTAAKLLGRFHEIRGTVVAGDQRGRTIGFPTANVAVPSTIALPADAVYAAFYTHPDGTRSLAAVNVGKRPTFYQDAEHSLLEAHLIDFSGDLYGQQGRVELVELLRSERRFDGLDELKAQLQRDIHQAKTVLLKQGQ